MLWHFGNSSFPWFWKPSRSYWANHKQCVSNRAIALLEQAISMILADFQTHWFYCKWKKRQLHLFWLSHAIFPLLFKDFLYHLLEVFFFFCFGLVSARACSDMSDSERPPWGKRHVSPDIFRMAQGRRIWVPPLSRQRAQLAKKPSGFSDQNLDLHQAICHHRWTYLFGGFPLIPNWFINEIFYLKGFCCDFFKS